MKKSYTQVIHVMGAICYEGLGVQILDQYGMNFFLQWVTSSLNFSTLNLMIYQYCCKTQVRFSILIFLCLCDHHAMALQHLLDVASCQWLHQQSLCTNDLGFSILTCLLSPSTFFTFSDFFFKAAKCKSSKFKF